MSAKPETNFRNNKVIPFLKTLKNTAYFPIQQVAILGDPDFILCCNGHFIALELKTGTGKVRALQKFKLDLVVKASGLAIVATPLSWGAYKRVLKEIDEGDLP